MRDKRKIISLRLKAAITGDKTLITLAEIKEREVASMQNLGKSINFRESITILEEHLKMFIDPKQMSVNKFHSHMRRLNQVAQKNK